MSTIDTPDYQRGVVSAQSLLAVVPAHTLTATVGIPPNAETLVLISAAFTGVGVAVSCVGVTSGVTYPAQRTREAGNPNAEYSVYVDVSSAADQEVVLTVSGSFGVPWYVYSDAGVHVVTDTSKYSNLLGQQYVIPSIPSLQPADHPPTELQLASTITSSNAALVAAPSGSQRIRVFTLNLATGISGLNCYLEDPVAGIALVVLTGPGNVVLSLPAQGYPLAAGAGLEYVLQAGSGFAYMTAYYTIEFV
jgi:hypothetical protein